MPTKILGSDLLTQELKTEVTKKNKRWLFADYLKINYMIFLFRLEQKSYFDRVDRRSLTVIEKNDDLSFRECV